jgi:hypothetical protein
LLASSLFVLPTISDLFFLNFQPHPFSHCGQLTWSLFNALHCIAHISINFQPTYPTKKARIIGVEIHSL